MIIPELIPSIYARSLSLVSDLRDIRHNLLRSHRIMTFREEACLLWMILKAAE
jgi:hypothetical protein